MFLIQTTVDLSAAVAQAAALRTSQPALRDRGMVLKTALTEALDGPCLRPFGVLTVVDGHAHVAGYADRDTDDLNHRRALALPGWQAAVGMFVGAPMPPLDLGGRYGFQVTLVPAEHRTSGGERDAFLCAIERERERTGETPRGLVRDAVYAAYLRERLAGAEIEDVVMPAFHIERMARPSRRRGAAATHPTRQFPVARLVGRLRVTDPDALTAALRVGVGRQRAYGYGWVRLQPT